MNEDLVEEPLDVPPMWLAEVLHIKSADRHDITVYNAPNEEGGKYFRFGQQATQWCEEKLSELAASGIHPSDLEARIVQGGFSLPPELLVRCKFNLYPYTERICRTDINRDHWIWTKARDNKLNRPSGGNS